MNKKFSKSQPIFSTPSKVDREKGVISDVVIVQFGENKNGSYFNMNFLNDIVEFGNNQPQGVKSRFGHPNMCATTLGTFIGRYKNFRLEGQQVKADLFLDDTAKKTPNGDLYEYTISMAENNPDMFGNSIVINAETEEEFDDNTGDLIHSYSMILESFIASDVVDSPAATNSLFSSSDDLGVIMTNFLEENPMVFDAVNKNPEIISDFFERYSKYTNKNKSNINMKILDNIKKSLTTKKKFNIDTTDADGNVVTVITDVEEPQVGDSVEDSDGNLVADGELLIADGTTWVIKDGKIEEIKPKQVATPESNTPPATDTVPMSEFKAFKDENNEALMFLTKQFKTLGDKFETLAKSVKSANVDVQNDDQGFRTSEGSFMDVVEAQRQSKEK